MQSKAKLHKTRVQLEIVPAIISKDKELAENIDALENEAQRLHVSYYGTDIPENDVSPITFREFWRYLLGVGGESKHATDEVFRPHLGRTMKIFKRHRM